MGFKLGPFAGLFPRVPETALPDNAATIAENIDFAYGEVLSRPGLDLKMRQLCTVAALSVPPHVRKSFTANGPMLPRR